MDTESKLEELHEILNEALQFSDITVTRSGDALVFWNGENPVGLEISEIEIENLSNRYEDETWEQVSNRILRDAYNYLVLKYL